MGQTVGIQILALSLTVSPYMSYLNSLSLGSPFCKVGIIIALLWGLMRLYIPSAEKVHGHSKCS